jgi:diaminopimelate epimerase
MNISIYKIKNKEVVISTFENGVGKTLSCGSAAASIAFLETKNKQSLKVSSEGGFLNFFNANDKLVMRGPTKLDFDGVINE